MFISRARKLRGQAGNFPGADTGGCIKNAQLLHGAHSGNRNTNFLL